MKIKNLLNTRDKKIKEYAAFKVWLDNNIEYSDQRNNKKIVKDYFKQLNK